MILFLLWG